MNMFRAFMELDNLYESASENALHEGLGRQELIANLKALGKNYNFDKWSDTQLYRIWEKAEAEKEEQDALKTLNNSISRKPVCNECGQELTDGGFCPNCDDGKDDLINESQENIRAKSVYNCTECGYEVEMYDDEFDGCCPKCHDHHGGFGKCEEALVESGELSMEHAVVSVVDRIKEVYEAGLFNKLPIGRDKAFTVDISGPDKERLAGYFKKQPEFNYELNRDSGIISHEFVSDKYDIEIFDTFIQMYRLPQNESLLEEPEKAYIKKNGDYIIKNDNGGYTAFSSHNIYLGHIEEEDPREAQFKFEKNKFDEFFTEGLFDSIPKISNWVTASGNSINNGNTQVTATKSSANSSNQTSNVVTIVYDNKAHKLRARANDGVHGEANVAFPNNLRTSEGQQYEVDELIWNGKNYRVSGNIKSLNSVSNTQNINENIFKETNNMNFQTILEELDKLYEESTESGKEQYVVKARDDAEGYSYVGKHDTLVRITDSEVLSVFDSEKEAEEAAQKLTKLRPKRNPEILKLADAQKVTLPEALTEADEEVLIDDEPIVEDEAVEVSVDETEDEETPKQLILECDKCGALVLKDEAEVKIDEATDLANVEDACQYCEESKGYKVIGALAPYEGFDEAEDISDEVATESLTEGKVKDSLKKIGTRLGADAATCMRGFAELISDLIRNDSLYDAAEYVENKAVLKALESGNETVLNTCTKEDIEELKQDIEEYKKAKANKKAGKASDKEDLEELLDVDLDVPVTIKADNNEVAVGGATV